jgi:uncharacterized membrane protein
LWGSARADAAITVKLKNSTTQTISVAVNFMTSGDRWLTRGWWEVKPGEIVTTDIKTNNAYLYFYAEGNDGGSWSGEDEDGSVEKWIVDDRFTWYDTAEGHPQGSGLKQASFFRRHADGTAYTQNFTE